MAIDGYLVCALCGARYYSVDARRRQAAGERCVCGGALELLQQPPDPQAHEPHDPRDPDL